MMFGGLVVLALVAAVALMMALWWWAKERQTHRDQLLERVIAVEAALEKITGEQAALAKEWSEVFGRQQSNWDQHIHKITQEATLQLALGADTRLRRSKR